MARIIVSSPLGFAGCTIRFDEIDFPADLAGCTSFVGHPGTKAVVEALGAQTVAGKWAGPAVGESYLAVPPIATDRSEGWTRDVAVSSTADLRAILCTRVA